MQLAVVSLFCQKFRMTLILANLSFLHAPQLMTVMKCNIKFLFEDFFEVLPYKLPKSNSLPFAI